MFGIDYLIDPVPLDELRRDYFGKTALLIKGDPEKFSQLYGWEEINHAANFGRLVFPAAKLVLNTNTLPADSLGNLSGWLGKGATLVLNGVQSIDPVVNRFVRILSRDMNTTVNVNCYASSPQNKGFDTHYDRHDVFIIQLAGRKTWRVMPPTLVSPVHQMKMAKGPIPDSEPYLECEMSPGDVLYIPRGHWHDALAVSPSIHLTVGPESRTAYDFLLWLAEGWMWEDEFFRQDFPIVDAGELSGRRGDDELKLHLDQFKDKITALLRDEVGVEQLTEFCMLGNRLTHQPTVNLPLQAALYGDFSSGIRFALAEGQKVLIRYDDDHKHATLGIRGKMIELENAPRTLVEMLFDGRESVTGDDIQAACPEIEWDKTRQLIITLVENGLLCIAQEQDAALSEQ